MASELHTQERVHTAAWERMRSGLIVSCQASPGTPLARPDIIAATAETVALAGAVAIRAEGVDNVRAVCEVVSIPVIGLIKSHRDDSDVYITPIVEHVLQMVEVGASIVAVDATQRSRWNGQTLDEFYAQVRAATDIPLLADIDCLKNAKHADELGFDAIATTLSGYTDEPSRPLPNIELVSEIAAFTKRPIVAEGGYSNPAEVRAALKAGAWAVCVGTAITNPFLMTQRFVAEI